MNKLAIPIIGLMLVLGLATSATAGIFEDIEFGMTPHEVKSVLHQKKIKYELNDTWLGKKMPEGELRIKTKKTRNRHVKQISIGKARYEFFFKDNKLHSVLIDGKGLPLKSLIKRYGAATQEKKSYGLSGNVSEQEFFWKTDKELIQLMLFEDIMLSTSFILAIESL